MLDCRIALHWPISAAVVTRRLIGSSIGRDDIVDLAAVYAYVPELAVAQTVQAYAQPGALPAFFERMPTLLYDVINMLPRRPDRAARSLKRRRRRNRRGFRIDFTDAEQLASMSDIIALHWPGPLLRQRSDQLTNLENCSRPLADPNQRSRKRAGRALADRFLGWLQPVSLIPISINVESSELFKDFKGHGFLIQMSKPKRPLAGRMTGLDLLASGAAWQTLGFTFADPSFSTTAVLE